MATVASLPGMHPTTSPPPTEYLTERFVAGGRKVRARRGFEWLSSGFNLFARSALAWIGAAVLYAVISVPFGIIPIVGPFVVALLSPFFIGGMMFGCRELDEGRPLRARHLFAGVDRSSWPLLIVGLLYVVATIAAALLASGVAFVMLGELPTSGLVLQPVQIALSIPIAAAATLVVSMAFIHTPALIAVSGLSPVEAIKSSFRGCSRNIAPFMVYVTVLVLFMVGTLGIFFMIGRAFGLWGAALLGVPYGIAFGSALVGSMFAAFNDIFYELKGEG